MEKKKLWIGILLVVGLLLGMSLLLQKSAPHQKENLSTLQAKQKESLPSLHYTTAELPPTPQSENDQPLDQ